MSDSKNSSLAGRPVLVVAFPSDAMIFFELDVGEEGAGLARAAMAEVVAAWKGRGPILAIEEDDVDLSSHGDDPLADALLAAGVSMVLVRSCKSILSGPGAGGLLAYLDKEDAAEITDKLCQAQMRQAVAMTMSSARLRPGLDTVTLTGCFASPEKDGDLDMLREMFEREGVEAAIHKSALLRVDLQPDDPQEADDGPPMI